MNDTVYVLSVTHVTHHGNITGSIYLSRTNWLSKEQKLRLDETTPYITRAKVFKDENAANDYRYNTAASANWQIQPVTKKKLFELRLQGYEHQN